MPRIGTLPLAVSAAWGSPLDGRAGRSPRPTAAFETTGSHVPHQSLSQARATSMPDTAWAVSRSPPRLIPRARLNLGFDAISTLSTRHQWFTRVRLPGSHLTHCSCAFSATLTTPALDRRSLRWFEASPCRAAPEGLPPSLMQPASVGSDLLHRSLLQPSWRTLPEFSITIPRWWLVANCHEP